MKKIYILILISIAFSIAVKAQSVTIYRGGTPLPSIYTTIQSALLNAINGDSIVLSEHIFFESNLNTRHKVVLKGTYTPEGDSTIIHAENKGWIIRSGNDIIIYDCILTNASVGVIASPAITLRGKTICRDNNVNHVVSGKILLTDSVIITNNYCTLSVVDGDVTMNGNAKITNNFGVGISCYAIDISDHAEISYNIGSGIEIKGNTKLNIFGNAKIVGNIAQPKRRNDPTRGGGISFNVKSMDALLIGDNVIISDNKADFGGGIWTVGTLGILDKVKILRNEAKVGAAIYSEHVEGIWDNMPIRMAGEWEIAYNNCNGCGFLPDSKAPAIFSGGSTVELYGGNIHHNYGYGTEGTSVYQIFRTRWINIDNIRMFNPNDGEKRKSEVYIENKAGLWLNFYSKDCWWGRSDTTGLFKIYGRTSGDIEFLNYAILDWKLNGGYTLDPSATEWEIRAILKDNTGRGFPDNSFPMLKAFHNSMVGVFTPPVSIITKENYMTTTYEKPDYAKAIAVKSYVDEDTFKTNSDGLNTIEHQLSYIKVHPNPANEIINIEGIQPESELYIQDLLGQKVISLQSIETKKSIDVSTLPPGIYMISIYHEKTGKLYSKFEKK
jgi:hypothetical protein